MLGGFQVCIHGLVSSRHLRQRSDEAAAAVPPLQALVLLRRTATARWQPGRRRALAAARKLPAAAWTGAVQAALAEQLSVGADALMRRLQQRGRAVAGRRAAWLRALLAAAAAALARQTRRMQLRAAAVRVWALRSVQLSGTERRHCPDCAADASVLHQPAFLVNRKPCVILQLLTVSAWQQLCKEAVVLSGRAYAGCAVQSS